MEAMCPRLAGSWLIGSPSWTRCREGRDVTVKVATAQDRSKYTGKASRPLYDQELRDEWNPTCTPPPPPPPCLCLDRAPSCTYVRKKPKPLNRLFSLLSGACKKIPPLLPSMPVWLVSSFSVCVRYEDMSFILKQQRNGSHSCQNLSPQTKPKMLRKNDCLTA